MENLITKTTKMLSNLCVCWNAWLSWYTSKESWEDKKELKTVIQEGKQTLKAHFCSKGL